MRSAGREDGAPFGPLPARRLGPAEEHLAVESLLHRRRDRPPGPVGAGGEPVKRAEIRLGRELAAAREEIGVLRPELAVDVAVAAPVLLVPGALVLAVLV